MGQSFSPLRYPFPLALSDEEFFNMIQQYVPRTAFSHVVLQRHRISEADGSRKVISCS